MTPLSQRSLVPRSRRHLVRWRCQLRQLRQTSPADSLSRRAKRLVLFGADAVLILACLPLAVLLHSSSADLLVQPALWLAVIATVPLVLYTFHKRGLYRAVLRYVTGTSMPAIIAGADWGRQGFWPWAGSWARLCRRGWR